MPQREASKRYHKRVYFEHAMKESIRRCPVEAAIGVLTGSGHWGGGEHDIWNKLDIWESAASDLAIVGGVDPTFEGVGEARRGIPLQPADAYF